MSRPINHMWLPPVAHPDTGQTVRPRYEYDYDNYGNQSVIRDNVVQLPDGTVLYDHDGRSDDGVAVTDTRYAYDVFGRLETVTVVARNDRPLATPEVTQYRYDAMGNIQFILMPNGVITGHVFDDLGRLDVMTHYGPDTTPQDLTDNPLLQRFDYEVRADGKRTGVVETRWENSHPLVTTVAWQYDNLGRLIEEDYDSHDDTLDFVATYALDLIGNRLTKSTDQGRDGTIDETVTYSYDANDRMQTEFKDLSGTIDGDTTTLYEYGPNADPINGIGGGGKRCQEPFC